MSLTLVERFQARTRVSAEIKVEFFPDSYLTRYALGVLNQDEQNLDLDIVRSKHLEHAKELYLELVFYFHQMAPIDARGFGLKYMQKLQARDFEGVAEMVQAKLIGLFKRAEHFPKNNNTQLSITKQSFTELLTHMNFDELTYLLTQYNKEVAEDREQAAKNVTTAALNGSPQ